MCKANGTFIRQNGGHYEYEGGDTRLVSVSNWVSLTALKEAMERVVAKAPTRSASGPPEVCTLNISSPFLLTVTVPLLWSLSSHMCHKCMMQNHALMCAFHCYRVPLFVCRQCI